MNVKMEKNEKNIVSFEIEVELVEFEKAMEKSYKKNVGKYSVPGFRKGKVPRRILERYYGEGILFEDAINIACPDAYEAAVKEYKIDPVERPDLDILQIGNGQNLRFTARVTVKPEVELGKYKGIEVEKITASVTDDQVDAEINKVQEKNARMISVEDRPVKEGDITIIDFDGFVDGVPFDGGKGEEFELKIGGGQFIKGFEEQIIGASIGDEIDVNVTFPEDYHATDLSGKPAQFKVTVNEIKEMKLPELDDEFAKDISEFDTLEEYKKDIFGKLMEKAEYEAKRKQEDSVVEKVVEFATVETPQVMIENRVDAIVSDFELNLRYQRLDLKRYLEFMGTTLPEFRERFKERAEKEVRSSLVVEKISKIEEIEVLAEEIEDEIKVIADNYSTSVEELKKSLHESDMERIEDGIRMRKTVDLLVDNAVVK